MFTRALGTRVGLGLAATLLLPLGIRGQAVLGGEWRDDVAAFANRVIDADLTPGMGIAVTVGDWVVYEQGFGIADTDTGRPIGEHTAFYIASSTKSLTGLAAALAVHNGDLELDAPLTRYLPDARLPEGIASETLTVRSLLALTHGMAGAGPVVFRTAFSGEFTRSDLLRLLQHHEPNGSAGTFNYNNLGYNLVGLVLEAIYDQGWKEVVRDLVLDPLGMTRTTAYLSRLSQEALAMPHGAVPGEGFKRIRLAKDDSNLHAAGGHFATPGDLARYLAVHLGGGTIDGARVLPSEPVLMTRQQQVEQDREFGPFHRFGWGIGWDLGSYEEDTLVHRFGAFEGYRSHMSFMPEHGLGVVVLVNGSGPASPAADLMATYIYDRLLEKPEVEARHTMRLEELEEMAVQFLAGLGAHLAERRARLAPLSHPLEAYAGIYENESYGRMEWRVVSGGLEVRIGLARSRVEVFDAAEDLLRVELTGGGQVVSFHIPVEGGPARSLTYLGAEFVRVEG